MKTSSLEVGVGGGVLYPDEFLPKVPAYIKRPCDYGLEGAICALETQLGTIEAYNRMVAATERLMEKIRAGNAKEQNPMFRTSTGAVE